MNYAYFSFSLLSIYAVAIHAAADDWSSASTKSQSMPPAVTTLRAFIYNNGGPADEQMRVDELARMSYRHGPTELFSPYYTALYYAYRLHLNPAVNAEMNKVLAARETSCIHIHLHNLTGELMKYQQHLWWADLVQLKRQIDARKRDAAEEYLDMIGNRIDDLQKQFHAIKTIEQLSQNDDDIWELFEKQAPPPVDCEEGPACLYQEVKRVAYAMENVSYPLQEEGEFVHEATVQKETTSHTQP